MKKEIKKEDGFVPVIESIDGIEEVSLPAPPNVPSIEREYSLVPEKSLSDKTAIIPKVDNITRHTSKSKTKEANDIKKLKAFRDDCIDIEQKDPKSYDNIIGKRLEHLIEIRRLTVLELAALSGVNKSSIYRYLAGEFPLPQTLKKLMDALYFDVSVITVDANMEYSEWQKMCDSDYRLDIDWESESVWGVRYSDFKNRVLSEARLPFFDESKKRIPSEIQLLFQQQLIFAFDTVELYMNQVEQKEQLLAKVPVQKLSTKQEKKK